ncbi:hypothetical protein GCM10009785_31720 [Brooklawnia cerclae]|uniref:Endolytic murein transglycosylase n=1 Tax=Brooklawnia cerclae TaxID=349934 RepID=A0ABX0SDS7_9ACTN|nr:endolytic transglycosylase MltG [Brooklawnia cerclae]NIH56537.1 UPF0755 protein [Brooklawnia cerclae]
MSRFLDEGEPEGFDYDASPRRDGRSVSGHRYAQDAPAGPYWSGYEAVDDPVDDAMEDTQYHPVVRPDDDPYSDARPYTSDDARTDDSYGGPYLADDDSYSDADPDQEVAYEQETGYEDDDEYLDELDDEPEEEYYEEPDVPRRRWSRALKSLLAVGLSLGILVGGGYVVYTKLLDGYISFTTVADYPGPGEQDVTIEIPQGASISQMGDILVASDVVASSRAFVQAAQENTASAGIQPGTYQLMTKMSASDAVAAMLDPNTMVRNQVTIPEGLRNTLVVAEISEVTGIAQADLEAALADPGQIGLPSYANGNAEGFLFPDTYAFDSDPTAVEVLSQMTAEFADVAEEVQLEQKAAALGITTYQAVVVASIIEKETTDPAYGPDIAQVLYNRLRMGMALQLDSTVIYANNSSGTITTTDEERALDSPYNTYVYAGLPPGAISNPGKNALISALNPTQGSYLYFVAVNPDTGETKFASDDAGHDANVAEFQAWCQANSDRCG